MSHSHFSDDQLVDYAAGRLPPGEVLAVSDGVANCVECRGRLNLRRAAVASAAAVFLPDPETAADDVPGYDEMAALLDGTLSLEQAADTRARLDAAPFAAAEFADLRAFREETSVRAPAVHGPASAERPAPGKIRAFPGWAKLALPAAAVLLLNVGWWQFSRRPTNRDDATALLAGTDLTGLSADLRRTVEEAARTGRVDAPARPRELLPPPGTLAGSPSAEGALRQVSPVGVVVREVRPRLRWQGIPGATSYVVYLAAVDSGAAPLRQELPANRSDWPPPAPLKRGVVYEWQIEGRHGDEVIERAPRPPAPEGRFEVLDAARAAELESVERLAHGNALVLGAAYERAGLRTAAAEQWLELARQHPESAVAARLRGNAAGQR